MRVNRTITIVLLILAGISFAEVDQVNAEVIISSGDSTITRKIEMGDEADVVIEVDKMIDEALDAAGVDDIEEEEREMRKMVRARVKKAIDEGEAQRDRRYERPMQDFWEHGPQDFNKNFGYQGIFMFMVMYLFWGLIFLIMWIITLVVFGRGFGKIAKALSDNKKE